METKLSGWPAARVPTSTGKLPLVAAVSPELPRSTRPPNDAAPPCPAKDDVPVLDSAEEDPRPHPCPGLEAPAPTIVTKETGASPLAEVTKAPPESVPPARTTVRKESALPSANAVAVERVSRASLSRVGVVDATESRGVVAGSEATNDTASVAAGPVFPAVSVAWATRLCSPNAKVPLQVQRPVASTVTVPKVVPPSLRISVLLGSPLPETVTS
ncbi:unnamed protein product [Pararhodospirillum photometricum DSM 122]|uniref:Uncharacterized protein n=1 Tax=Pararhodospirillum photometricum DSM 122 TaxID=1150469 RepID=H6SMW6_PARPM|nr:unnamed protein product [Pararhodospirillum photometricum DSM 122]